MGMKGLAVWNRISTTQNQSLWPLVRMCETTFPNRRKKHHIGLNQVLQGAQRGQLSGFRNFDSPILPNQNESHRSTDPRLATWDVWCLWCALEKNACDPWNATHASSQKAFDPAVLDPWTTIALSTLDVSRNSLDHWIKVHRWHLQKSWGIQNP